MKKEQKLAILAKLEEMYPDRILGIDASGTIGEIAEEIAGRVSEIMAQ